jgi:hypothetical protein
VDVASGGLPAEFALFGEDASRAVIACDPAQLARIKEVAARNGLAADVLGETGSDRIEIKLDGRVVISGSVAELRDAYETALEAALRADPELVAAD